MSKGKLEHAQFVFVLVAIGLFASAAGAKWPIVRVANSPGISDRAWAVDGNSIVAMRDGSTIVLYKNGGEQILASGGWDRLNEPDISGDKVVWSAWNYGGLGRRKDYQVYLYDGVTTRMLSDPSYFNGGPKVSGQYIAWSGSPNGTPEIFLYDGQTTQQITNNSVTDSRLAMDGNRIVWRRDIVGEDYTSEIICYYDGTSVQQLTDEGTKSWVPQIAGDKITWLAPDDHDIELFLYDGQSVTQISNSGYDVVTYDLDEDGVAWSQKRPDGKLDIWYSDGVNTTRVTDNANESRRPVVSGGLIAWEEYVDDYWQIFLYDKGQTYQLTDAPFQSTGARMSGSMLAWNTRYDGYYDIYAATIPEPATLSLLATGGLAVLRRRKK